MRYIISVDYLAREPDGRDSESGDFLFKSYRKTVSGSFPKETTLEKAMNSLTYNLGPRNEILATSITEDEGDWKG